MRSMSTSKRCADCTSFKTKSKCPRQRRLHSWTREQYQTAPQWPQPHAFWIDSTSSSMSNGLLHSLPFRRWQHLDHIDSPKNSPSSDINISLYTQSQFFSPSSDHISIIPNNNPIFPSFRFLSSSQSSKCLALRSRSDVSNSPPKHTLLDLFYTLIY
jgi:hypothetical protein